MQPGTLGLTPDLGRGVAPRTNFRRSETKRKKEFSLEAWEKETSNPINKNNEKAEKYYTNEGTN